MLWYFFKLHWVCNVNLLIFGAHNVENQRTLKKND